MENSKHFGLFIIIVLSITILTVPISVSNYDRQPTKNTLSDAVSLEKSNYPKGTFIFDIPTLSQSEKNNIARKFHGTFPKLVEVMLELRRQNVLSSEDLKNIHRCLSDFALDSSLELPHNDKDLIDYLYDNNLINEVEYKKILELLED